MQKTARKTMPLIIRDAITKLEVCLSGHDPHSPYPHRHHDESRDTLRVSEVLAAVGDIILDANLYGYINPVRGKVAYCEDELPPSLEKFRLRLKDAAPEETLPWVEVVGILEQAIDEAESMPEPAAV